MTLNLEKIQPEIKDALEKAPMFPKIKTPEQADEVNHFLDLVKDVRKKIQEFFNPEIEQANKLHKSLIAKRNQVDEEPAKAEATFRGMLAAYVREQKEKAEKEQARLDEIARQKAIKEAEKTGDQKTVKAIETGKVSVISEKVAKPVYQPVGVSSREYYRPEITDLKALAAAVASGTVPEHYILPNMQVLNSVIRSTKGQINIPGVICRKDTGIAKR